MMERTKVVIVHGAYGSPSGNWFPWMCEKLRNKGVDVSCPAFPTPDGQHVDAWQKIFEAELDRPQDRIVLVGHSIGSAFLLKMAERADQPYRALFCVCPFVQFLGNEMFDKINKSFVAYDFDWKRVKSGASYRVCWAGSNDPYVPLDASRTVASAIDADFIQVEAGGHLNAEFGYTVFPALYEQIEKIL